MAVSMLGVSEAFALGQSLGISASTLTKIFNCSNSAYHYSLNSQMTTCGNKDSY
ncbi:putative 6-phosphogluconate dehydrogenase, domain 2 [Lupinus albus]|uniref:Putative 6-phosphogluconate dehydrogenase, domain 2 n=1 Tax=Lupinus albus TaxID=3870 RepID=A0A6A4R726_LUPAL|nr:putative 6-phosphogluconate dehydrogenase, domain 2 [Lupinus albus]